MSPEWWTARRIFRAPKPEEYSWVCCLPSEELDFTTRNFGSWTKFFISYQFQPHELRSIWWQYQRSTCNSERAINYYYALTTNRITGHSIKQPISLTSRSVSSSPFISMNPLQVNLPSIVIGFVAGEKGSASTFIIMTILGYAYTTGAVNLDPVMILRCL